MKVFEDYFSELQADMVSICLEYSQKLVNKIYIYCSYEPESYFTNVFFECNGKYAKKHKINDILDDKLIDVSSNRQQGVLRIIVDDLREIHKKCKEFDRDMPTEIKMVYDVKKNSLEANYKNELIYSNDDEILPDDIFNAWFEEISNSQQ